MKSMAPFRAPARCLSFVCLLAVASLATGPRAEALDFDFEKGPSFLALETADAAKAAEILASVETAAAAWEGELLDPVTVTVALEIGPLPPGVFASGMPETFPIPYTDVATKLIEDKKSLVDDLATGELQPGPFLEAVTNDTTLTPSPPMRIGSISSGGPVEAVYNSVLLVPTANAKALGVPLPPGPPGAPDGVLLISADFVDGDAFDYSSGDGIDPTKFDFETIGKHELAHILGFLSGVDSVDFAGATPSTAGPDHPKDLKGEAVFKPFDLFRYSSATAMDPEQPTSGTVLDWTFGPDPSLIPPPTAFFSVDGGTTPIHPLSGGLINGDGEQAGHWLDDGMPYGIMVPDLDPGEALAITMADVTVLDAIGWDTVAVPEPAALALAGLAVAALAVARRRVG